MRPELTRAVVFYTRSRPAELRRALASFARQLEAWGRNLPFLVLDDARNERERANTAASVERFARRSTGRVFYVRHAEKRTLADDLARAAGAPPGLVRFALFGAANGVPSRGLETLGANRNTAQLLLPRYVSFHVDDDVIGELARARDEGPACRFFANRAALERAVERLEPSAIDLIGLHERYIGPIGPRRVIASLPGTFGDAAIAYVGPLLTLSGASFADLTRDSRHYRRALASRMVFRCAPAPTITREESRLAPAFGLDARVLLPPFFPFGRSQASLFIETLRWIHPRAAFSSLPIALGHFPRPRHGFEPAVRFFARTRLVRLLLGAVAIASVDPRKKTAEHRIDQLGRHLVALASLRPRAFRELASILEARALEQELAHLAVALARNPTREPWSSDVHRLAAELESRLSRCGELEQGALVALRRAMRDYGELLQVWPALIAAAALIARVGKP